MVEKQTIKDLLLGVKEVKDYKGGILTFLSKLSDTAGLTKANIEELIENNPELLVRYKDGFQNEGLEKALDRVLKRLNKLELGDKENGKNVLNYIFNLESGEDEDLQGRFYEKAVKRGDILLRMLDAEREEETFDSRATWLEQRVLEKAEKNKFSIAIEAGVNEAKNDQEYIKHCMAMSSVSPFSYILIAIATVIAVYIIGAVLALPHITIISMVTTLAVVGFAYHMLKESNGMNAIDKMANDAVKIINDTSNKNKKDLVWAYSVLKNLTKVYTTNSEMLGKDKITMLGKISTALEKEKDDFDSNEINAMNTAIDNMENYKVINKSAYAKTWTQWITDKLNSMLYDTSNNMKISLEEMWKEMPMSNKKGSIKDKIQPIHTQNNQEGIKTIKHAQDLTEANLNLLEYIGALEDRLNKPKLSTIDEEDEEDEERELGSDSNSEFSFSKKIKVNNNDQEEIKTIKDDQSLTENNFEHLKDRSPKRGGPKSQGRRDRYDNPKTSNHERGGKSTISKETAKNKEPENNIKY